MPRPALLRLLAALGLLLAPVLAQRSQAEVAPRSADIYVNTTRDTIGAGDTCQGGAAGCPLRRAIQLANATPNTAIRFDGTVFTSDSAAPPISLGAPLDQLNGAGTQIIAAPNQVVKVTFAATATLRTAVFQLNADDIILDGLRVYGAQTNGSVSGVNVRIFQGAGRQITVRNATIGGDGRPNCAATNPADIGIDISSGTDAASAIYLYGNTIECQNTNLPDSSGIMISNGRNIRVGVNESGQSGGALRNTIRSNRHGINIKTGTQGGWIKDNLIIRNAANGIVLAQSSVTLSTINRIENNFIGTDGQSLGDGNSRNGIAIIDSNRVTIKSNVISGNQHNGISVIGDQSTDTLIESNIIGAGADLETIIPNGTAGNESISNGIYLGFSANMPSEASSNARVGGEQASQLNVIGGNRGNGIMIEGSANNTLLFNDIGYASANNETALPNGQAGIRLSGGASGNQIGQVGTAPPMPLPPAANYIWYNTGPGVRIDGATNNSVNGNSLRGNATGVHVLNATGNRIFRARIVENTGAGILEEGSSTTVWSEISMADNGGGGIDKTAATPVPPAPRITAATRLSDTSYRIVGTGASNATVEIYLVDPAHPNEGSRFVGRGGGDNDSWIATVTLPANSPSITFIATQSVTNGGSTSTSEFSQRFIPVFYAPLLLKP